MGSRAYRRLEEMFREKFHSNEEFLLVHCLGETHRISFTSRGRIRLWDHSLSETGMDRVSYNLGAPCSCLLLYDYFRGCLTPKHQFGREPPLVVPIHFTRGRVPLGVIEELQEACKRIGIWVKLIMDWYLDGKRSRPQVRIIPKASLADMELFNLNGAMLTRWALYTNRIGHEVWNRCPTYRDLPRWHIWLERVVCDPRVTGVAWTNSWQIRGRNENRGRATHIDIYVHPYWWHRVYYRGWAERHGMFVIDVIKGSPNIYRVVGFIPSTEGNAHAEQLATLRIRDHLGSYEVLEVEQPVAKEVRVTPTLDYREASFVYNPYIPENTVKGV